MGEYATWRIHPYFPSGRTPARPAEAFHLRPELHLDHTPSRLRRQRPAPRKHPLARLRFTQPALCDDTVSHPGFKFSNSHLSLSLDGRQGKTYGAIVTLQQAYRNEPLPPLFN
jgi:hypothetical protein